MTLREGRTSPEVVTGTLSVFGYLVPTLLDPGLRILLFLIEWLH